MRFKKFLQNILDKQFKKELTEYFGENCYVKISNLTFVRSKNSHLISLTLYVSDPEKIELLFPDGLEMIINRAWKVVGDKKNIIIQSSFDLIP